MIKLLLAAFSAGLLLSSALAEEASVKEDASAKEDASMKAALAASVNEALAKRTATRFVPTGTKRSLWFLVSTNIDCSLVEGIEVRTTKEPTHGAVEIAAAEGFGAWPRDTPRFKCNEKKLRGLNVNYKSSVGYVGPDEFDLLVLWPQGIAWEMHFNMIVR